MNLIENRGEEEVFEKKKKKENEYIKPNIRIDLNTDLLQQAREIVRNNWKRSDRSNETQFYLICAINQPCVNTARNFQSRKMDRSRRSREREGGKGDKTRGQVCKSLVSRINNLLLLETNFECYATLVITYLPSFFSFTPKA